MKRGKLLVERCMDNETPWPVDSKFPHCDARILHLASDCGFCAQCIDLQEERERLGVSNTGQANRFWPCPADQARSSKSLNSWYGNRAQKQCESSYFDPEEKEPFSVKPQKK